MHKSQESSVRNDLMRRPFARLVIALAVMTGSALSARVLADAAPAADPARNVAAAVQSFYDQTKDVSATFHQTYVNKLYQRTDRSSGRVVFKKPGMMRAPRDVVMTPAWD